jgi:hypothetical protein
VTSDRPLKAVARRDVDMVAAWSVDRLGRSPIDLLDFLRELHVKGVDLFLHQQGLATSTSSGRAMSQMLGVFERAMIRERVTDAERVAAIVAALLPGPASAVLPAIWAWEWERCCGLQVQHSVLLLVSGNVV